MESSLQATLILISFTAILVNICCLCYLSRFVWSLLEGKVEQLIERAMQEQAEREDQNL